MAKRRRECVSPGSINLRQQLVTREDLERVQLFYDRSVQTPPGCHRCIATLIQATELIASLVRVLEPRVGDDSLQRCLKREKANNDARELHNRSAVDPIYGRYRLRKYRQRAGR